MSPDELSKLSDEELERRIADSRPNSYVPSSIFHAYIAEQEKRKHQSILRALTDKKRITGNTKPRRRIPNQVRDRLFTHSRNKCAFPECSTILIDRNGLKAAEIAHIEAESPGGLRYNKDQSENDRFGYDNLILLCPTHHTLIDKDVQTFSVETLKKFKKVHESGGTEVVLEVGYIVNQQKNEYHEYTMTLMVKNNSGKSINKPKLKITMPKDVVRVTSSRGQKSSVGKSIEIYFEELDISAIHPGEQKKLMNTSNVGIIYFMDSDLYDNPEVMNQILKVELFADNFQPVTVTQSFKKMQRF